MNNAEIDPLGPLLRNYLSARLDGQLGKAEARFVARHFDAIEPLPAHRPTPRRGRLFAAVAATAASISVAVWCGFHVGRQPAEDRAGGENQELPAVPREASPVVPNARIAADKPLPETASGEASFAEPVLVGQQLQWQTIDEGIVYLDAHTPVRKLRRQRFEKVEWYDAARGARVQMIVPHEEVQFVALSSS